MPEVFLTTSIAFIITFIAVPVVIGIAESKRLYDLPNERKVHTRMIASLGGIGIFGGFVLSSLLSIHESFFPEFQFYYAAILVIFILGLMDDLMELSASKKLVGQVIAASILVHLGDIRLTSMHGLFGIQELPEGFSLALSYLTIIVVINSFNLIDGVDGLASGLGIVSMVVFGAYFLAIGLQAYALFSFALAGSLLAFLIFNHQPARIFMGDSGSLLIGLVNAILVIRFINVAEMPGIAVPVPSAVAVGIAILIVPLLDTLRVFSIRMLHGRSPFSPDKNHIHHFLLDTGLSHAGVGLVCVGINFGFILMAWWARSLGNNIVLLAILLLSCLGYGMLYYGRSKRSRLVHSDRTDQQGSFPASSKIVKLNNEKSVANDR